MSSKDTVANVTTNPERSAGNRLRLLDFDDLFLLGHLLDGNTIAATAKLLGLTQPAITQRVRKIERVFEEPILQKAGRHVKLTPGGQAVCVKAADALALMRAVTTEPAKRALAVGASAAPGSSWLWPALLDLRVTSPEHQFHCVIGQEGDLQSLLDTASVDAVLTTKGVSAAHQTAIELGEEEFIFVAAPELASKIAGPEALAAVVLLELDRSYPLLARLDVSSRAAVHFRDVWFAGAFPHLLQAAVLGHGVAILPEPLAQTALASGKLVQILPELETEAVGQRLIYRSDRGVEELVRSLVEALRRQRPQA